VARVFSAQVRASGKVPQLSVVLGPAAGGAAYGPALTDVIIMGPEGRVLVTGPDVVKKVTGQDVDSERLGGPDTHSRSGVVHVRADSEQDALERARVLVDLLGRPSAVDLRRGDGPDPGPLVPSDHRLAYDMGPVVRSILDEGTFVELQEGWASNIITGLGRLAGRTVGVVANNPSRNAGCLDATSGDKSGRFVQWCDAHGVPLVFLVDVPGYLPGVGQEDEGVVRRGAKLLHAYAGAVVPRLTVVLRKSFGGAFIAMGSKGLGADSVFAWPGAHVDVMGASAAVEVLHRRELAAEQDPEKRAELVERLAADHESSTGGLDRALGSGAVDEVVPRHLTRRRLVEALHALPHRRGEHRNPPL
jgi:acetyl-CoA/propionyl-CoA carboxylase carboxyl transferase subunit